MHHHSRLFFRRGNTEPPQIVPADQSVAFLPQGVSIKGSVKFLNGMFIDGEVKGTIDSAGTLTIGEHARIRGNVTAKFVKARGAVEGNIFATERCELQAGCTLHGDIAAPLLVVDENVTFCGDAKVGTGKLRPAVEAETPGTTAGDVKTTGETAAVATFYPESIGILEQWLGAALLRHTRGSWASADGSTVVICKASRTYVDRDDYAYRFGLYDFQMEMITAAQRGYCALQCGGPDQLLLLPANDLSSWSDLMDRVESKTRPYRHVHISADFHLIRKPGSPTIDLRRYLSTRERREISAEHIEELNGT
jgi:cytoskeletal protein CcmA (bactofilin family)